MDSVERFYMDITRQYSRQSFQNRAKIRTPDGAQWISVPLMGHQFGSSIGETRIDYSTTWQQKHKKALQFNYGSTPFFEHYRDELFELIDRKYENLGALTVASTRLVHRYLRIAGSLELGGTDGHASDDTSRSDDSWPYEPPAYLQNFDGFVPGLSILDILFNHGPESTRIVRSGIKPRPTEP